MTSNSLINENNSLLKVGVRGGNYTVGVGYQRDVQALFALIDRYAVDEADQDWSIITDRLYRHYIAREDWDRAIELMDAIRKAFARVSTADVDWASLVDKDTQLDCSQPRLDMVFGKLFPKFADLVAGAKLEDESENGFYDPVRIAWVELPGIMFFKSRFLPLSALDAVEGEPLWMSRSVADLKARIEQLKAKIGHTDVN